jgi:Tol biopolymer transport system component
MIPQNDEFERRLSSWLHADAPDEEPAGLLAAVATRTASTRRRPAWAIVARWMPERVVLLPRVRTSGRTAWLLAVMAVVAALGLGILAAGSLRRPPPVGPARAGLIAFDSGGDIVAVDAGGGNRRSLTTGPALETSPIFSPDGTRIAYWRRDAIGMPGSLWVMNADGSGQREVTGTVDFAGSENLQAAWSPDSRRLAFSVGDYFSSGQLFVVGADGAGLARVGDASLARTDPAWSPDGRLIAFRGHSIGVGPDATPADPAIGVYVIDPDGSAERKVSQSARAGGAPNFASFGGPEAGSAASWSPDGRSLLYGTGPLGRHALAIAAVDGSAERIIDLPAGDHLLPAFSPDASRIAYEDLSPTGDRATAYVVNSDGTAPRPLEGGAAVALNPLLWSPDGRFVVTYSLDLSEVRLVRAVSGSADGSVGKPSTSIALGASTVGGFPERVSWQRLAP